ncbi:hypothetical protein [Labilithrix luteola]|uniref:hypothetical protein n=1 Tax=Labilithrix luteola TaxID=1391654 RepID=UPI0011BAC2C1|nr:hypothetical protein [Labilithrix luteola]
MFTNLAVVLPAIVHLRSGAAAESAAAMAVQATDESPGARSPSASPEASTTPTSAPPVDPASAPPPCVPVPCIDEEHAEFGNRTLKGHTFLYPQLIPSAFVTSFVGIRGGIRNYTVDNLPTDVPDHPSIKLELFGLGIGIELGIKLTDWLSVEAVGGGRTLIGSNVPALVYNGATYAYEGRLGFLFRLLRLESSGTQVGARIGAGYSSGVVTSLAPLLRATNQPIAVEDVVDGNIGQLIKTNIQTLDVRGSLVGAQAFGDMFGLQLEVALSRYEFRVEPYDFATNTRLENNRGLFEFDVGAAFSVDLAPRIKFLPLAAMVEYQMVNAPATTQLVASTGTDTFHNLAAGIYWSGQRHLQLGLIGQIQLGLAPLQTNVGESSRPTSDTTSLVLRYVW